MKNKFEYSHRFAIEFENYTLDQQTAVLKFLDIFEQYGLKDFSVYQGKFSPSWKGLDPNSDKFKYAFKNKLWHYHIGLPEYTKSQFFEYHTSDWVLHFIKFSDDYIVLVDLYQHYTIDGVFYIPSQDYLEH